MRTLAIAACVLGTTTAAAQPAPSSPSPIPATPTAPQREALSETTALWLGIGTTAASWSLLAVGAETNHPAWAAAGVIGTFLAPGSGQLYAGSIGARGVLLRLAGIGVFAVGGVLAGQCEETCRVPQIVAGVGLGIYLWGTIDNIATAPAEVRRRNERNNNLLIVPVAQPDYSGVMFLGRF